jgi:hypothetical protein
LPSLFERIIAFLEEDDWASLHQVGGHSAVEAPVQGQNGRFRMVAVVDQERSIVRFLTFVEGKIPESRRREVMEYLTRANYGLMIGNFEMDLSDGEVRFKSAIDSGDVEPDDAQLRSSLYFSVATMDRYYPGLQRVIQGSADPAAAIADVED